MKRKTLDILLIAYIALTLVCLSQKDIPELFYTGITLCLVWTGLLILAVLRGGGLWYHSSKR